MQYTASAIFLEYFEGFVIFLICLLSPLWIWLPPSVDAVGICGIQSTTLFCFFHFLICCKLADKLQICEPASPALKNAESSAVPPTHLELVTVDSFVHAKV